MRFEFRFDRLGSAVMTPLGAGRKFSHIDVTDSDVDVRLGWTFSAHIPRASVQSARLHEASTPSRGAHGWRGRWLVNGASTGLVAITLDPPVKARVTGVPVTLRELIVSADAPDDLVAALTVQ
jgi:hypothetical protein